ncbi:MAG: hypothetical protein IMZ52_02640 [Actinobacteria bacterium]|nr:hypothetical protein [Actinomycetota bacterium]MBE3120634.1 hypothetical protein [Thermoplasmata archaeon]
MAKNRKVKKSLTIGIIFLLICLAIAPGINANLSRISTNDELLDITIEIIGLEDTTNLHTVKITKQQSVELEKIFNTLKSKLNKTTTREETIAIFNKVIIELDNNGLLLEGISVKEVQRLITENFQNFQYVNSYKSALTADDKYENLLCYIAGNTTLTSFLNKLDVFLNFLGSFLSYLPVILIALSAAVIIKLANIFFGYKRPYLMIFGDLTTSGYMLKPIPSNGWIWTNGLFGVKNWTGSFYGNLFPFPFVLPPSPGVSNFRGISIRYSNYCYFLGTAFRAKFI